MKVLITGINGFIGKYLAVSLLNKGHDVVGLGRRAECQVENVSAYYCGDILKKDLLNDLADDVDVFVHLAALTAHKDIIDNRFNALEINFLGTKNVLDAFTRSKTAKRFIYSSTGKVYGDIKQLPITEDHPTNPLNALGKSKLITEKLIDFYQDGSKDFVILRIFNGYGPLQKENFLVPTIFSQLGKDFASANTKEVTLGDITAKRDYLYIDDLINAFVLAIESPFNQGLGIYNICSGVGMSAQEIVEMISEISGVQIDIKVNKGLLRSDEKDIEYGSYEKARQCFGWAPQISLPEGLKRIIEAL